MHIRASHVSYESEDLSPAPPLRRPCAIAADGGRGGGRGSHAKAAHWFTGTAHCARFWLALFCPGETPFPQVLSVLQCREQLDVRGHIARGCEDISAEYGVQRALSHHDRHLARCFNPAAVLIA